MGMPDSQQFVRLYPIIKVKTAKPIRPTNFVGPCVTTEKDYECSELRKIVTDKFWFLNILKVHKNKIVNPQNVLLLFDRKENAERLSNIEKELV